MIVYLITCPFSNLVGLIKDYQTLVGAFIGAIIVILGWEWQSKLSRENLTETARLNRLQASEDTIIKQIEFHYNLLKGVSINIGLAGRGYGISNAPDIVYGQNAFEVLYSILRDNYITMPGYYIKSESGEEKLIEDSFTALYMEHGSLFGNYFKNLYLIIDYIDITREKDLKRDFMWEFYIDLIKAQLSKYEILLLAYDCIWIQGDKPKGKEFIDLAKKYELLSALEIDELIYSEKKTMVRHEELFKSSYGIIFNKPVEFNN